MNPLAHTIAISIYAPAEVQDDPEFDMHIDDVADELREVLPKKFRTFPRVTVEVDT